MRKGWVAFLGVLIILSVTTSIWAGWISGVDQGSTSSPSPYIVKNAENPDKQEQFRKWIDLTIDPGYGGSGTGIYVVPAGKRLVIEYATVNQAMPVGQKPNPYIQVQTSDENNLVPVFHYLIAFSQGQDGSKDLYTAGGPLTLRLNPGESLILGSYRNGSTGTAYSRWSISGYLINYP